MAWKKSGGLWGEAGGEAVGAVGEGGRVGVGPLGGAKVEVLGGPSAGEEVVGVFNGVGAGGGGGP